MNFEPHLGRRTVRWALLLAVALWAGCASHKAKWNAQVGVLTYDQAVLDMGPPDKEATLTNGSRVAEWMTLRGHPGGFAALGPPVPMVPYRRHHYFDSGYPLWYEPASPSYWLRLEFGADGKLVSWRKFAR